MTELTDEIETAIRTALHDNASVRINETDTQTLHDRAGNEEQVVTFEVTVQTPVETAESNQSHE